jgi:hypothetical protein
MEGKEGVRSRAKEGALGKNRHPETWGMSEEYWIGERKKKDLKCEKEELETHL